MALPLVIPNCVQVRLLFSVNAQLVVNVLHASVTGAVTVNQALANTLGSAIKSSFSSTIGPLCSPGTGLVRVGVRDLRAPNLAEFLDTGALVAGSGTGDPMPAHIAACITLRTAGSGKSFRGRVYLSGFNETNNDGSGNASAAVATQGVAFITGVNSALQASQMVLSVATRPQEEVIIVETTNHSNGSSTLRTISHQTAKAGVSNPVTVIQSRNAQWETQRRRSNGRGLPPTLLAVRAEQIL